MECQLSGKAHKPGGALPYRQPARTVSLPNQSPNYLQV